MADISRIQDLTGTIYDLKDAAARADIADISAEIADANALVGNMLPEFCDFPETAGLPTKPITIVWNEDKTSATISNIEAASYANYIGLYDPIEFELPGVMEYNKAYTIHYTTTDPNVTLYIEVNGPASEYTGDATLTVPEDRGFMLAIKVAANALVNATITISMPCPTTNINLQTTLSATSNLALENSSRLDSLQFTVAGKVDKVSGKGLSTNDYTTEEKSKLAEVETKVIPSGGTSGQYIKKFSGTELDFDWNVPDANEITWIQTKQIPVINEVGAYNYHQWAQGSATGVPWTYYTSFSLSGNDIVFHGQTTTSVIMIPSEAYDYYDNNGTIIPCKIIKGTKIQNTIHYVTLGYYAITGFTTEPATYTNGTVAKTLNDYETRIAALENRVAALES